MPDFSKIEKWIATVEDEEEIDELLNRAERSPQVPTPTWQVSIDRSALSGAEAEARERRDEVIAQMARETYQAHCAEMERAFLQTADDQSSLSFVQEESGDGDTQ
jgi:hypothetical protein